MRNVFSSDLEKVISAAYRRASGRRHASMGVEDLMLALLDEPTAIEALTACGADLESLRGDLVEIIEQTVPVLPPEAMVETQPTLAFQRVLQRAVYHVQSSGGEEVTGTNVLVALFGEKDSHALRFLQQHGVSRIELLNHLRISMPSAPAFDDRGNPSWRDRIEARLAAIEDRLERIGKKLGA